MYILSQNTHSYTHYLFREELTVEKKLLLTGFEKQSAQLDSNIRYIGIG